MFTQDEKIEIFKENLGRLIAEMELPISVVYYILNDYTLNIKQLYDNYQTQVQQSIAEKIRKQKENNDEDKAVE